MSYHSIQWSVVPSSMTSRPSWLAQWCGKKARKKCFVRRNKFNAITVPDDYYSYILRELCHIFCKKSLHLCFCAVTIFIQVLLFENSYASMSHLANTKLNSQRFVDFINVLANTSFFDQFLNYHDLLKLTNQLSFVESI